MTETDETRRVRAILLPIDDGLCNAREFLRPALEACAGAVADRHGGGPGQHLANLCTLGAGLASTPRELLRRFLRDEALPAREEEALLAVLRESIPGRAPLLPDGHQLLSQLPSGWRAAAISDGDGFIERAKVGALGLGSRLDLVILTEDHGQAWRRPSVLPYRAVLTELELTPPELLCVACDPLADIEVPVALGMPCVRLRRGQHACEEQAAWIPHVPEIEDLSELDTWGLPHSVPARA